MADRNQKLESVLNDPESDSVAVYVLALALMYHRVTGSYWKLLGSKTHYLDFYQHVVELRALLQEWTTDASSSTIFMEHLPPLFGQHMPEDDCYQTAVSVSERNRVITVISYATASVLSLGHYGFRGGALLQIKNAQLKLHFSSCVIV